MLKSQFNNMIIMWLCLNLKTMMTLIVILWYHFAWEFLMICSFAYGSIVLNYRRCSSSGFSRILEVVYVYGVNFVKSLFKGQQKRLDDANLIRDLNDSRISWMVSFVSWLDNWKTYSNTNNTACLTNETYTALRHTVNTIVYMLYELLNSHTLDYVMLV